MEKKLTNIEKPWASGPKEILLHALELLEIDNDSRRRLAMITIDNAIELMSKTYLGLPSRVTGLTIPRKEYQEFSESFPKLLDALEKYASGKLQGIDLGEIEWYHRIRNQLYHQGNGITVEKDKVEVYAELANVLFQNLFGFVLIKTNTSNKLLSEFIDAWVDFERSLNELYLTKTPEPALRLIDRAKQQNLIPKHHFGIIDSLRQTRNMVVHGQGDYNELIKPDMTNTLKEVTRNIREKNKR